MAVQTLPRPRTVGIRVATTVPAVRHSVHHFGIGAIAVLATGVLLAILTTTDPLWWHLHFSRLGMFDDFSGHVFNSTAIAAGLLLATYGVLVVTALPADTRRGASRAFRVSITSAGLHLTAVGLIPITVSPELHDVIASGLGLSLLAVVSTSLGIPGIDRRFRLVSVLCSVLLVAGMVVLTMGLINLACFEFVGFTSVGLWLGVLPAKLPAASRPSLSARPTPSAELSERPSTAERTPARGFAQGIVTGRRSRRALDPTSSPARRLSQMVFEARGTPPSPGGAPPATLARSLTLAP